MNNGDTKLTSEDVRVMSDIRRAYARYRYSGGDPRRHRGRAWIAGAVVLAGVAVAAALALRPSSAVATWTREPTSSETNALADATIDACGEQAAHRERVAVEAGHPADPAAQQLEDLPLVAHDQRGDASAALFADLDSGAAAICAIVSVEGQPPYVELTAATGLIPDDRGLASIWIAAAGTNWDYGSRWEMAGRVAPGVDRVVIVRDDGERVTATLEDSWFLAWWPSGAHPVALEISEDGAPVETIDLGDEFDREPPCRIRLRDWCLMTY